MYKVKFNQRTSHEFEVKIELWRKHNCHTGIHQNSTKNDHQENTDKIWWLKHRKTVYANDIIFEGSDSQEVKMGSWELINISENIGLQINETKNKWSQDNEENLVVRRYIFERVRSSNNNRNEIIKQQLQRLSVIRTSEYLRIKISIT